MSIYVSFVVTARNDNYGGDFLHRMQVFVGALDGMWRRHGLEAELVIIEWNPPAGKPGLREAVQWPREMELERVRIVGVPNENHRRLPNAEKMPMFEYMAKNVGIRRARGEYVLVTNPDIIFDDRIMARLARRNLREDCFYRADRYDVAVEVPTNVSLDEQLRLCASGAFRAQRMGRTVPLSWIPRLRLYYDQESYRLAPRWILGEGLRRLRRGFGRDGAGLRPKYPRVHVNASGDFLLMSAKRWSELRGYPELPSHSHIDSFMVYLAAIAGLRQVILRGRIYHQEHDRSEQQSRPLTILDEVPALRSMLESGRLQITNGDEWGLGRIELPSGTAATLATEARAAGGYV